MLPLKVAFMGGSLNSAVGNCHRIALQMDNQFELVSGCFSRDAQSNSETADSYGVDPDRCYSSLQQLLENEINSIDALILLTPTPAHFSDLMQIIPEKLPIICEKAVTTSTNSMLQVIDKLKQNEGFLRAIYNYTGYPMVRELQTIVTNGVLGDLKHIEVVMPQEGFLRLDKLKSPLMPQAWRQQDEFIPTVSLDLGIHAIQLLRFVTGFKAHQVVAHYSHFGNVSNVIDDVKAILTDQNDVVAQVAFGKVSLGEANGLSIKVHGTTGSASWKQMDPEYLHLSDRFGSQRIIHRGSLDVEIASRPRYNRFKYGHPSGFIEAFANHYQDIAHDINVHKHARVAGFSTYTFNELDAMQDLNLLHAFSESHYNKSWVTVS